MKFLTFLAFVLAGLVLFSELHGKKSIVPSFDINKFQPAAPRAATASASPAAAPSQATSTASLAAPQVQDAVSSTLNLLKEKLAFTSASGPSFLQKTCRRTDLRIARGIVQERQGSDLLMNCGGWIVNGMNGVYAGDGEGMNVIYANLVETHEQFQFGRLMTVDKGVVRQSMSVFKKSMWNTGSYLDGLLVVRNYPAADTVPKGKGIKIVVAPSGYAVWSGESYPSFTATFTLED